MLTLDEILKAARLMSQVGDPRPGYLREDDSCLIGPTPNGAFSTSNSFLDPLKLPSANNLQKGDVCVDYETDQESGEIFVIQRLAE